MCPQLQKALNQYDVFLWPLAEKCKKVFLFRPPCEDRMGLLLTRLIARKDVIPFIRGENSRLYIV
jgi:hypothetical protein